MSKVKSNLSQSKLYITENGNSHRFRSELKHMRYRYERGTKKMNNLENDEVSHISHKKKNSQRNGYDYKPLFNYLLKQVGKDWNSVWKDIYPRIDNNGEPVTYMVQNVSEKGNVILNFNIDDIYPIFRYGLHDGNRVWSTLYVDKNNILQYVDKNATPNIIYQGFGQSFNGKEMDTSNDAWKKQNKI